jgi:PIN domain nuclease of toxin-antitoxin system
MERMKILVDAYCWIEYLEGGRNAQKIRDYLFSHDCYTAIPTLAETVSKVKRKGMDPDVLREAMKVLSTIISIDEKTAFEAGKFHAEQRRIVPNFGLSDAHLVILGRNMKAKILTADKHFKDFKDTILLDARL